MRALSVSLGGVEVGLLEHFENESELFTFSDNYVSAHIESRPVLGQMFEDRLPRPISVGGPICWFDHLLPQGTMRRWRTRLLNIDEDDGFSLLVQLGENLPGAVIMRPTAVSLGSDRLVLHLPPSRSTPHQFRFSLAGAQWKLSARSVDRGLTTSANAQGVEYIAKFHSPEFPGLPSCEFATMNWAKNSGIVTPDFELRSVNDFDAIPEEMPTGDGVVFLCRRFDRESNRRIHMEDFGQILDRPAGHEQYNGSYEEIASVLSWIAPDCIEELLRVITFCIISGNGDAHLKNFSVQYKDGRAAILSPAYDLVATIAYYPPGREKLALKLGGSDQFESFALYRFRSLFQRIGWEYERGCILLSSFADQILAAWNNKDISDCFTHPHRERIEQHVNSIRNGFLPT